MKHLFLATKMGWEREQEGVWLDSNVYTKEQAQAQFKPVKDYTKDGYPYTRYEYDGQIYHDVTYLGEFEDEQLPQNDSELLKHLISKLKETNKGNEEGVD